MNNKGKQNNTSIFLGQATYIFGDINSLKTGEKEGKKMFLVLIMIADFMDLIISLPCLFVLFRFL